MRDACCQRRQQAFVCLYVPVIRLIGLFNHAGGKKEEHMKKITVGLLDIGQDSESRIYFRQQYIDRLHEAGAEVLMIPQDLGTEIMEKLAAGADELTEKETETAREIMEGWLEQCDGLLLPGGGDIDSKYWGEERKEWAGEPTVIRDLMEPLLLKGAMNRKMPVLGICRGVQCINVFCGGSLYQDVVKDGGTTFEGHSDSPRKKERVHGVTLKEGSWLANALGTTAVGVNTMHHQAVNRVAPGFEVTAVSEDGLIEGLEYRGASFCVGVQWHPEHMAPRHAEQCGIFAGFLEECRKADVRGTGCAKTAED